MIRVAPIVYIQQPKKHSNDLIKSKVYTYKKKTGGFKKMIFLLIMLALRLLSKLEEIL